MLLLKHTIEYLTNNGELDTSDGQRLLTTSLEKLAKSNSSDLKDCDCRKGREIRILFGKTKHSWRVWVRVQSMWTEFSLKSDTSVVKATTRPRSAIRNVIVALSFRVSGQYFKDYHKILWTPSLDQVNSTRWIHIVRSWHCWMACTVRKTDRQLERERSENWSNPTEKQLSSAQLSYRPRCQEWENYRLSDLAI